MSTIEKDVLVNTLDITDITIEQERDGDINASVFSVEYRD